MFQLRTFDNKTLKNVIVEDGSTLFRSGEGNLYSNSGKQLYTLNVASPTGILDVNNTLFDAPTFEEIPTFSNSIHTVNYTIDEEVRLMDVTRSLSNLRTVNITGECTSSCSVYIDTKSTNLTI